MSMNTERFFRLKSVPPEKMEEVLDLYENAITWTCATIAQDVFNWYPDLQMYNLLLRMAKYCIIICIKGATAAFSDELFHLVFLPCWAREFLRRKYLQKQSYFVAMGVTERQFVDLGMIRFHERANNLPSYDQYGNLRAIGGPSV
ncbi:unnamed protein product [Arctia plantaginis]|uniref:Uncharacterized protein n=1 Tax=Arctia plantaginis TaxID=874455 RepID=A0A8S1BPR1_ARCPL|nr:unnamed protein product [Arctia plantaginis]